MTKTPRMQQIEAMLADEPDDEFLRYGLAMEHSSAGDDASAAKVLLDLIALNPAKPYIPAFLMAAQALLRTGDDTTATTVLKAGIGSLLNDLSGKRRVKSVRVRSNALSPLDCSHVIPDVPTRVDLFRPP